MEIKNESGDRDNFTMIPNFVFRLGMSPQAVALYGFIKQAAGETGRCYKSTSTIAKELNMSAGTVSSAKQELANHELIKIYNIKRPQGGKAYHSISILDVWARNAEWVKQRKEERSQVEQANSEYEVGNSDDEVASSEYEIIKNPPIKNTRKKNKDSASNGDAPAVESIRVGDLVTSNAPTQEQGVAAIYTNNASTHVVKDDDEMMRPHYCGLCGSLLQAVRPGKWQCDTCESKQAKEQFDALPSASAATVKPSKRKGGASKEKCDTALYPLAQSLAVVCGDLEKFNNPKDKKLRGRYFSAAKDLSLQSCPTATPELIGDKFGTGKWYWLEDWRGQKGEYPNPQLIVDLWGDWMRPKIIPFGKRGSGNMASGVVPIADALPKDGEYRRADFSDYKWRRLNPLTRRGVIATETGRDLCDVKDDTDYGCAEAREAGVG